MIAAVAPRGPRGHWLLGSFRAFRANPLGFLVACREFGDAVPLRMLHRRAVILYGPEAIEQVLVHRHRSFRKHFALRLARPVVGDGLLTSEGDTWVAHRRLAQPAFRSERIAAYATIMLQRVEQMLGTWRVGETFDLHEAMMRLTSGIVTAALFGTDITDRAASLSRAMETLVENFSRRLDSLIPPPLWLPIPRVRRFRRARAELESLVSDAIAQRRRQRVSAGDAGDGADLLGALLRAHEQEGGAALSDRELRDEMVTLFVAGHETTANALTWTFWLLARHPEAEARLHAELDQVLAGRAPTPEVAPKLPWLRRVLDESMRVMPPAWIIGREALEPVEIAGLRLRAGTTVLMPQWAVHRDPRWFPEPDSFRPQRWEDGLAERIPRFAYFPFGGGPRHCIGEHFARLEATLLLAAIASRFRLRLAPDARVELFPSITLRPRHGVAMVAERRS